jgi:predicted nuclease of predicted toxin-antitoxin system
MMLKFKIDENLPVEAAELLTRAGHDAMTIHDQRMVGRPDSDIAAVCQREGRVVVTLDLDFAGIRVFRPSDYHGIVVLRLAVLDKFRVMSVLQRLFPILERESLPGKLWIVDESSVRIRS